MKTKKKITIICALLAAALLVAGITVAISPSSARTLTEVTWSGIAGVSDLELSSDYLVTGGQTVDVGYITGTHDYEICIYNGTGRSWSAQVVSSDAGNLAASLSEPVTAAKDSNTQILKLTLTVAAEPYSLSQTETSASQTESSAAEGGTTTAAETQAASYPETAEALITLSCEDTTLSASFRMHFSDAPAAAPGNSVANVSPYFGQYIPVQITGGEEATRLKFSNEGDNVAGEDGKFPAGTAYTVNNARTVLYNTGYIICPAGASMEIDFASILVNNVNTITITPNGSDIGYSSSKLDVGAFPTDEAVVLTDSNGALPVKYSLEDMNACFSLEKYNFDGANVSLSHVDADSSVLSADSEGCAQLDVTGLEAGTYRLTLSWKNDTFTICSITRTVFVRHTAARA